MIDFSRVFQAVNQSQSQNAHCTDGPQNRLFMRHQGPELSDQLLQPGKEGPIGSQHDYTEHTCCQYKCSAYRGQQPARLPTICKEGNREHSGLFRTNET